MKRYTAFLSLTILAVALTAFTSNPLTPLSQDEGDFVIPENIDAILNNSCYGCHNSESENTKAKLKLKLDELPKMKKSKLASKLSKIAKQVQKGKMPTKKFLEYNPDKALKDDEKTALIEWANKSAAALAGE